MEVTLEQLLKGKATQIGKKSYFSTKEYIEPFIDYMSKFTDTFIYKVKLPKQITVSSDGDILNEDITYNRVWIQSILPDELNFPNHKDAIHLFYALDCKKPLLKIARSAINGACLNQCIFSPSFIHTQALESGQFPEFTSIKYLMEETSDIFNNLTKLRDTSVKYNTQNIQKDLGYWIDRVLKSRLSNEFGSVKLSVSTIIDAYKLLYLDNNSLYYVEPGEDTDMFNIYNAFTEVISHDDKDILNVLEKTLLLKDILNIA